MAKIKKKSITVNDLKAVLPDNLDTSNWTDNARQLLKKRYFLKDENGNPTEDICAWLMRVAAAVATAELSWHSKSEAIKIAKQFFMRMLNQEFLPNTPCLANAGKRDQMLSACFTYPIEDNMQSIYKTLTDTALTLKMGGGVGFNFSHIRPEGSLVASTGGAAGGPLMFMGVYNESAGVVKQGGMRHGAHLAILEVWHPDIRKFIHCKDDTTQLTNFNISVGITNAFMKAVVDKQSWDLVDPNTQKVIETVDAVELFNEIVEHAHATGEPGVIFLDTINENNALRMYGDIESTNPCQISSAPVLTPNGIRTIGDIVIGDTIWSKSGWTNVVNKVMTGIKPTYRFRTSAGSFLGTDNHRIIQNGEKVEVKDATSIDILAGYDGPVEIDLQDVIDGMVIANGDSRTKMSTVKLDGVQPPSEWSVPDEFKYGSPSKVAGFLRGMFAISGDIKRLQRESGEWNDYRVVLKVANLQLADDIQLMLSSIGIRSYLTIVSDYEIHIVSDINVFAKKIGFIQQYKDDLLKDIPEIEHCEIANKLSYTIKDREYLGNEEVYSITVDNESHTYWTGGLNVANCGELPLLSYESCLTGDTNILTPSGVRRIDDMANEEYVFSGDYSMRKFNKVVSRGIKPVYRVWLDNKLYIDGTEDHLIQANGEMTRIDHLKQGMVVDIVRGYPLTRYGGYDAEYEMYGRMHGEGTAITKELPISFYSWSINQQLSFMRGLFGADGEICGRNNSRVTLASSSRELIDQVQRFLATIGISSCLSIKHNTQYVLLIRRNSANKFMSIIGMSSDVKASQWSPSNMTDVGLSIDRVEYLNEQEVYDIVDVDTTNTFYANGVKVHNCNLGSINITKAMSSDPDEIVDFDKLEMIIRDAVRFLDDVIDVNDYPIPEVAEVTRANRKIGLGVMGFADLLMMKGIPYGSQRCIDFARTLAGFIFDKAKDASYELAEIRGGFPNYMLSNWYTNEELVRNAALCCIAPTGSISILANCSASIEPLYAVAFKRNILEGTEMFEENPIFKQALMDRGLYSKELIARIADSPDGTVTGIGLPADIEQTFKTAHSVTYREHIAIQSAFQEYFDSSISKTINMVESATKQDIHDAYMLAWQWGCKGCTVYRNGSRTGQPMSTGKKPNETQEKPQEMVSATTPTKRAKILEGITEVHKVGSCGSLYVTVNKDGEEVVEIMAATGRASGCASMVSSLCRVISIALRSGISVDPILEQLVGIRCTGCIADPGTTVLSCPDALGHTIKRCLKQSNRVVLDKAARPNIPICDECGSIMIFNEGCYHCSNPACSASKCS